MAEFYTTPEGVEHIKIGLMNSKDVVDRPATDEDKKKYAHDYKSFSGSKPKVEGEPAAPVEEPTVPALDEEVTDEHGKKSKKHKW